MSRFLRPFWGLTLGLLLAFTGQSMAVARGVSTASGQMVICVGAQTITVYVDAEGQPIEKPHICPDCLLTFGEPIVHYAAVRVAGTGWALNPSLSQSLLSRGGSSAFLSRGPPYLV